VEVIFEESGKNAQAEDFKIKMCEVCASAFKGLDSFTIMAKHNTPPKISSLLLPMQSIIHETESIKMMNLIEEVLKCIAGMLNSNKNLVPTSFSSFATC
jgi:U3 small nucleolar RNA-associated protein 20